MLLRAVLVYLVLVCGSLGGAAIAGVFDDEARERLWAAVRGGDLAAITRELDAGTDINSQNEIGLSALWIASANNNRPAAELLISRGADVNVRDKIWYMTPLSMAVDFGDLPLVERLLQSGAQDVDPAIVSAAAGKNGEIVAAILATKRVRQGALDAALYSTAEDQAEIRAALAAAGAKPLPKVPANPAWNAYVGEYFSEHGPLLKIQVADTGLQVQIGKQPAVPLIETAPNHFRQLEQTDWSVRIQLAGDKVEKIVTRRITAERSYFPIKPVAEPTQNHVEVAAGERPRVPWPQFRGPDGRGVVDGQEPPVTWDLATGQNVAWKTDIPGLGHSCPVVWGDRIFVTTAISSKAETPVRVGNYGDTDSVDDETEHTWQVFCLDWDGKIVWTQTAYQGIPKIKRHLKGSQANCTPATDGKHVVACFGSEGLYCYDFAGKLLWKRDLSSIDSSFAVEKHLEWGFASSPLIFEDTVIIQFDLSKDSFIAAFSLDDGNRLWSTPRDEIPSWSSPVLWRNSLRTELVTNASQYARSYDPVSGKELWRLAKKSEATIPAPVIADDLIFITSGNRPIQPIFAVRAGAHGDISLPEDVEQSEFIAWSRLRGGPYMPTPIVYGPYLYVCSNAGVLTCYEVATGKEVYRERMGGESYTSSPVAADGRIYFTSEQGEVRVVKAGPDFELLAVNKMDDICMAVPAISGGRLYVRTQHALVALEANVPAAN